MNALSLVSSGGAAALETARTDPKTGIAVLDAARTLVWCNQRAQPHMGNPALRSYLAEGDFAEPLRLEGAGGTVSAQVLPFIDSDWLLLLREDQAAADAMRRDFVADTSHELRAPLCVLTGLIDTMTELDIDPARSDEYLDLMAQQCKRMRNIVDGLLELSAIEAMPEPGRGERINVAALLARLRAEADVLSGGRHQIFLDAQPGFDLLGTERDITSALGNLVANAVRYTQPGGEIRVLWSASARGGEFTVQDTGVGIDAKHIPLLTERFYRVQKAMHGARKAAGGAGLGLAIVKAALARHQATLEIFSEAGKGSRFIARFPAHRLVPVTSPAEILAA
jgi:two-component system phosphate regulon sensor histidine kinase PhoR